MDEDNKLPLKRVEFSLTKFNDVAIPHHLDLLRQHKANIIKYEEQGRWAQARGEQVHARRVAAQLRALLLELDALRRQVRVADRARFDALTQRSRDTTLRAIVDYLGTSPLAINRNPPESVSCATSAVSTDSVGVLAHAHAHADSDAHVHRHEHGDEDAAPPPPAFSSQIQLRVDDHEVALREREALLRGWAELQADVRALHDVWQHAQAAALSQREQVTAAAGSVDAAAENTSLARNHLAAAERLQAGAWGAGGAALGLLAGGPVGLAVGAKAGALAAAAGSLLGYLGGRLLRRRADAADNTTSTDSTDSTDHVHKNDKKD